MALRHFLAIMRMFWPDGCVGGLEIDRKSSGFWNKCINEFLRYYTYDPRFATKAEAMASILAHMRDNLRRTLSDDKERADVKIAGASGTNYAYHRPLYMKPGVWSRLSQYWVSEEFKKKSAAGKKARQAVKVPHTSGSRSFDHRRRDYMEAHDGKLNELAIYKECNTLKDEERKGEWITEDAQKIILENSSSKIQPQRTLKLDKVRHQAYQRSHMRNALIMVIVLGTTLSICEYLYDPAKGSLKQLPTSMKLRYSAVEGSHVSSLRKNKGLQQSGSLVMATSLVIAQNVAFMVKHGSGILSVGMKCEDLERLKIPLMSPENEDDVSAPSFTVSVPKLRILENLSPSFVYQILGECAHLHSEYQHRNENDQMMDQKFRESYFMDHLVLERPCWLGQISNGQRTFRYGKNQDAEAELDTEKAYKQIDKLKRKHERDISAWKQLIAESRLPKEAIEPVYDDRNTTKYDGVEPETTTLERRV
ncbi:hypothetical protein POM88_005830 [Heracleum sosnowskyi]|uniref:Uncharacterized protein n=1 Tax=Heracleum sosnowskyi TaxID=360622 RepID=A0AAD8J4T1_9APIA|nr:hypothetical protein POM88_005830 [Heracleum sosnowskyi]